MNKPIPLPVKNAADPKAAAPLLTIGIDLGDQWSQLCLLNADGEILERSRLKSSPPSFTQRFAALAPARIAIEAGTHSLWVKELLAELGHEVLVANARELRAISASDRKNDKADAEKLARYARVDPAILRPIVHRDSQTQADLLVIRARAALIRMRSLAINAVRGLIKPFGYRLSACSTDSFVTRCRTELPSEYSVLLAPLLEQIASLTQQIRSADRQVEQLADTQYPEAAALQKVPGVGPLTALRAHPTNGAPFTVVAVRG
jgi:transposase